MKYIGNFSDWIKEEWVDEILNGQGLAAPRDMFAKEKQELHKEDIRVKEAGYDMSAFYYTLFEQQHVSFNLDIPGVPKGEIRWWITKMVPGQFMPVHQDPRITTVKNIERYWMPWTDWECGHIFLYEDSITTRYHRGDLFLMTDPNALHGAANIGTKPRITLNIGIVKE